MGSARGGRRNPPKGEAVSEWTKDLGEYVSAKLAKEKKHVAWSRDGDSWSGAYNQGRIAALEEVAEYITSVLPGWTGSETDELRTQIKELEKERDELRAKLDRLPADWHEDSSLETWFPYTAQEIRKLEKEREARGRAERDLAEADEEMAKRLHELIAARRERDQARADEEGERYLRIGAEEKLRATRAEVERLRLELVAAERERDNALVAIRELERSCGEARGVSDTAAPRPLCVHCGEAVVKVYGAPGSGGWWVHEKRGEASCRSEAEPA